MLLPKRDFLSALIFWLMMSCLLIFFPAITKPFELKLKDLKILFNAYYNRSDENNVMLLAIDSETLATAQFKWPWPQNYWAKLIDQINTHGKPRAIIIDVYFQTPDGTESQELIDLAAAIKRSGKTGLVALYEEMVSGIGRQLKFVPPHKMLRTGSSFIGLSQQPIDEDGKIRSFLLQDKRIDSRHIAWTLLDFLQTPIKNAALIGKKNKSVALIDFSASESGIPQISLKNLIENPDCLELVNDSIVVIGATAPVLHDYHQTPTGLITGPEIICNTIITLASGKFQLLEDSLFARFVCYIIGVILALAVFSDIFSDNNRKMFIIWLALPILLFVASFMPLFHPPVTQTWLAYTLTAMIIFIMFRFLEISELRQQLLEAEICGTIQKNFFPAENLHDPRGVTCYGLCIPYKDAGGDFYDFFTLNDGRIFFMLGDVTGHGISASMITTVAKSIIIIESEKECFDIQNLLQEIGYTIFSMTNKRRMMSAVAG
jgi:CHASE2 domain-containing sensor protein